jgi:hypothetical protein
MTTTQPKATTTLRPQIAHRRATMTLRKTWATRHRNARSTATVARLCLTSSLAAEGGVPSGAAGFPSSSTNGPRSTSIGSMASTRALLADIPWGGGVWEVRRARLRIMAGQGRMGDHEGDVASDKTVGEKCTSRRSPPTAGIGPRGPATRDATRRGQVPVDGLNDAAIAFDFFQLCRAQILAVERRFVRGRQHVIGCERGWHKARDCLLLGVDAPGSRVSTRVGYLALVVPEVAPVALLDGDLWGDVMLAQSMSEDYRDRAHASQAACGRAV